MISWKPVTETTPKNVRLILYFPAYDHDVTGISPFLHSSFTTCHVAVGRLDDLKFLNGNIPTFYSQCNIPERASISRPANPSDECYNCHGTGLANDEGVCHVCNGSGKNFPVPGTFR